MILLSLLLLYGCSSNDKKAKPEDEKLVRQSDEEFLAELADEGEQVYEEDMQEQVEERKAAKQERVEKEEADLIKDIDSYQPVRPKVEASASDSEPFEEVVEQVSTAQDETAEITPLKVDLPGQSTSEKPKGLDRYKPTIHGLIRTARIGTREMCRFYLKNGIDVNAQNSRGETPLHAALRAKRWFNAKFFIENDAKLDIRDVNNVTARKLIEKSGNQMLIDMIKLNQ